MRQEWLKAQQDYIRGLVRQSTLENLQLLLTSTKETYDAIRALTHIYQEGFYRAIWAERYKKMCEWENSIEKKAKRQNRTAELEYLKNSKRKTHQNQKACV
ncbi:38363_t:CDS:2 [Gigaspora margarita]|uniref:38363_t:CDS:1 n=1 Tax=Gigaspora margarita TaxID=4874 RepID=A0ABN7W3V3_GIGMA|nr:38363_t:CDS:2 [Gigaspora margarita]